MGAQTYPEVRVPLQVFEAACATRVGFDERYAPDVYLAAAIEHRDPGALRWLQRHVHRGVQSLEGRVPQQLLAEVESSVLELVAVAMEGRPPRIRQYSAKGPLVGWLQVVVVRMAQKRATTPATRAGDGELESTVLRDLEQSGAGLEVHVLRSRFHGALGAALRLAANKLTEREQSLLRLHYVDGVGLHELARAYQVHRATISRWLLAARDAYLVATRDELSSRTGIAKLEVDSLVRTLQSHVEVSLRSVFSRSAAASK